MIGIVAFGLLAFVIDPSSLDKVFGRDPNIMGKVNGDKITREELDDQITLLQQQQPNTPREMLEEQAWQLMVQAKLIKQQFDKMGIKMSDELFWNQVQFDPAFAQNKELFDQKGNFKVQEVKRRIQQMQQSTDPNVQEQYDNWLKMRKGMEYRIMARLFLSNVTAGVTANQTVAAELLKERDTKANIEYVKIGYNAYAKTHKIQVTNSDLENYIKEHPITFKTDATRNLGVVLFSAKPSAADAAAALKQITQLNTVGTTDMGKGTESFQSTKNDSMFVTVNSDVPFNGNYLPLSQEPEQIRSFLTTASAGQSFGPYKIGDSYYAVSKLLGKQARDSVQARHILIAFKGSQADQGGQTKRTKEQAQKLADSIATVVKADPAKFTGFVKLSADPGSAQQGGQLGWVTNDAPLVPEFKKFLMTEPKGTTGVVETQFGFHVINIENKIPGGEGYKVATLAKKIKITDATSNKIYAEANGFIQKISGASFNDFKNIAKKDNYNFQNPTAAKRFQGQIQGIGTDQDSEVLAWAFDKKTKIGDTNLFTTSNGDYIVSYLVGKQDAGLMSPNTARPQIEATVRNQLLAKQISDALGSKTSLDQIAKEFKTTKLTGQVTMMSPMVGGVMEPKVAGAAFGVTKNKLSKPVQGVDGVYVLVTKSLQTDKQGNETPAAVAQMVQQQSAQMYGQQLLKSLQDNAKIKDFRNEALKKQGDQ